jgi:tetratricopeptide (TPR) repeat protein
MFCCKSSWFLFAAFCLLSLPSAVSAQVAPVQSGAGEGKKLTADQLIDRCVEKFHKNDLAAALQDCTEAISHKEAVGFNNDAALAYRDRGAVRYALNDFKGAFNDYKEADKRRPDTPEILFGLGVTSDRLGDKDSAMTFYTKAIDLGTRDATVYLDQGLLFFEKHEIENAIKDYDSALILRKDFANAYVNRAAARRANNDLAGVAYQHQKEFEKALADYRDAVRLKPDDVRAYYNLGEVEFKTGDPSAAIRNDTKAIELGVNTPEVFYNRGLAYAATKEFAKALEDFTAAISRKPEYGEAYYGRGLASYEEKHPELAIADYTKAIELKVDSPDIFYNRGLAYQARKEFGKAIEDFTAATGRRPEYGDAFLHLGESYNEKAQWDLAEQAFRKAFELKVDSAPLFDGIGLALYKQGKYDEAIADFHKAIERRPADSPAGAVSFAYLGAAHYRRSEQNGAATDVTDAIKDCTDAIRLNDKYADAYFYRSLAYAKQGDESASAADLAKAVELAPSEARRFYRASPKNAEYARLTEAGHKAFVVDHDFQAAFADYDKAVALNDKDALGYYGRALARYELIKRHEVKETELDAVIADFSEAISRKSFFTDFDPARAYNGRGSARRDKQDLAGAEKDFRDALAVNADYADARLNLAEVLLLKRDWTGALAEYDKGIPLLTHKSAVALEGRGLARYKTRDWPGAIADYREALALEPPKPYDLDAWLGLADALSENGDWKEAIEAYDAADRIKPRDAGILLNRGYAHYKMHNSAAAEKDYSAAIALNPKDVPAYYDRGFVRYESDRLRPAFGDYNKALALKPHGVEADDVKGVELGDQGQLRGALVEFNKALKLKPEDENLLFNRAEDYRLLHRYKDAKTDYEAALAIKPEDADVYCSLGELLQEEKDLAGARQDYEKAVQFTKPKEAEVFFRRAEERRLRHDFSCAMKYYDEAIRLKQDWAEAYYGRAIAKGAQDDLDGALSDYNTAIAKKPDFKNAFLNRSDLWRAKGDLDKAKADYAQAKQLGGGGEDEKRLRNR